MNQINYYEVLEIRENASHEVVRMAYKALALKYHPDKFNGDIKVATQKMQIINEAYDVISNPVRRNEYDDYLRYKHQSGYKTNNRKFYEEDSNEPENEDVGHKTYESQSPFDKEKKTQFRKMLFAEILLLISLFVYLLYFMS